MRIVDGLHPNRAITARIYLVYAFASLATFVFAWQLASGVIPTPSGDAVGAGDLVERARAVRPAVEQPRAQPPNDPVVDGDHVRARVSDRRPGGAQSSRVSRSSGSPHGELGFVLTSRPTGPPAQLWMLVFDDGGDPLDGPLKGRHLDLGHPAAQAEVALKVHAQCAGIAVDVESTPLALETLRQNAAMGWMMLTMVEGVVRSEGGVGTMLLNENKHLRLDAVFALILVVLLVGVVQDYALAWLRRIVCPYADLAKERR
jgi:hypothetical protein